MLESSSVSPQGLTRALSLGLIGAVMLIGELRANLAAAEHLIKDRTPKYMHLYVRDYLEHFFVMHADDEQVAALEIVCDFLDWCKNTDVLEPVATHRKNAVSGPSILRERGAAWDFEVNALQLEEIRKGLRKLVIADDFEPVSDIWSDNIAEELLNMLEEGKLCPSPIINCLNL